MPASVRWRLDVAYDGTDFSGWAEQAGLRTVQGELQLWLTRILRLEVGARLTCAGRTDAGVHARGQVAHLDLPPDVIDDPQRLLRRLARALPSDVVVSRISLAPLGFDARFAAIWRRYCYRIADGTVPPDPLLRRQVTHLPGDLDMTTLEAAVPALLGLRDFGAFCRRREGATTVRTLLELAAVRVTSGSLAGIVEITVRADAFCHSMVRSLVGALVEVGSGRRDGAWLTTVTAAARRDGGVPVLAARGLTLEEVAYPPADALAARVTDARQRRRLPDA